MSNLNQISLSKVGTFINFFQKSRNLKFEINFKNITSLLEDFFLEDERFAEEAEQKERAIYFTQETNKTYCVRIHKTSLF